MINITWLYYYNINTQLSPWTWVKEHKRDDIKPTWHAYYAEKETGKKEKFWYACIVHSKTSRQGHGNGVASKKTWESITTWQQYYLSLHQYGSSIYTWCAFRCGNLVFCHSAHNNDSLLLVDGIRFTYRVLSLSSSLLCLSLLNLKFKEANFIGDVMGEVAGVSEWEFGCKIIIIIFFFF